MSESYLKFKAGQEAIFKESRDTIKCIIEKVSYEDNGTTKDGLKVFILKDISNGEEFRVTVNRDNDAYCP